MKKLKTTGIIFLSAYGFGQLYAADQSAIQQRALEKLSKLPLAFEINRGQTRPDIDYVGIASGSSVYLTSRDALFLLPNSDGRTASRVNLNLLGGRKSSGAVEDKIPGYTNSYLLMSGSSMTRFDKYAKVRYRNVWPGIDMVYYGKAGELEFDFIVAPGKNPGAIGLRFSGEKSVKINASGDLEIGTPARTLIQHKPEIYQEIDGVRHKVNGHYALARNRDIRFVLGDYDHARPLVIDPKLTYSDSSIYGTITAAGFGVAIDNYLNAYYVGKTFPSLQQNNVARLLGFLFAVSLDTGGTVTSSFILGRGDGDTIFNAVAVDASQRIYITGSTSSPTLSSNANGFQPTMADASGGNPSNFTDALLVVFSTVSSTSGVYFTYIGGPGNDAGTAVTLDNLGNVYVAGTTSSTSFPITVGSGFRATGSTAFLVKVNPAASGAASRLYSTLIGGTGTDTATSVVADLSGNAYVGGTTTSLSSGFRPSSSQGFNSSKSSGTTDGFLVGVASGGATSNYLTFFPSAPVNALAYGIDGKLYATGQASTNATNGISPVTAGYQSGNSGGTDAFLAKIDPTASGSASLLYFTYLGGSQNDAGYAVGVDQIGNAFVAGQTSSANFPILGTQFLNSGSVLPDAFAAKINTNVAGGNSLTYSGLIGGSGADGVLAGASDKIGNFYLTGATASSNFPVTANTGPNQNGTGAFATKLTINCASKAGVFRSGSYWVLDANGNTLFDGTAAGLDIVYQFGGIAGDIPIVGDWSGDGVTKIGIYRPAAGAFLLDYNGNGQFDGTPTDKVYYFAGASQNDVPVIGDWNGSGYSKVGVFRQGYFWILDYNGDGVFTQGVDKAFPFGGAPGDVPVVGDWNGTGTSKVGLFRAGFFWLLDINGNGQYDPGIDAAFPYGGAPGDVPMVGDWNGSGTSKVGLFRAGFYWVLDSNGNHLFDQGIDFTFPFGGLAGDVPVVGCWR